MSISAREKNLDIPGGTLRWMTIMFLYTTGYTIVGFIVFSLLTLPVIAGIALTGRGILPFMVFAITVGIATSAVYINYEVDFDMKKLREELTPQNVRSGAGPSVTLWVIFLMLMSGSTFATALVIVTSEVFAVYVTPVALVGIPILAISIEKRLITKYNKSLFYPGIKAVHSLIEKSASLSSVQRRQLAGMKAFSVAITQLVSNPRPNNVDIYG